MIRLNRGNYFGTPLHTSKPFKSSINSAFNFSPTPSAKRRCARLWTPTKTRQQINHTHSRPRIEHIETVSAQDIPRFGKLGVIASFQPLHAYPDEDTLKVWLRNAGRGRANGHGRGTASKIRAGTWLLAAIGRCDMNPWYGVQNALTRQTREGEPPDGFVPHERISLEDAIKGYTLGSCIRRTQRKNGRLN